jgi:hypothetical protein
MQRGIRELLTHARESFDTIQLEWTAEYNTALLARTVERSVPDFHALVQSGAIARLEAPGSPPGTRESDQRFRHEWRLWWRKPSCWRDDIVWENGATAISLVCGASSSSYISLLHTLYTNRRPERLLTRLGSLLGTPQHYQLPTVENRLQQTPLVDPSFFASGWELTVQDDPMHAGRSALRVLATRRGAKSRLALWDYVDQYEILVDAERGVLSRYAGIVDGEEAGVFSVRAVHFDEPIADEVFSYQPPKGTRIARV